MNIQLFYVGILFLLQSRWTNLKKDLLTTVIPMFLSNHPNSVPVLQAAWHCTSQSHNVRSLVLHAMAEWYMRGEPHDQARLSRILDVAQDLKVHCQLCWCKLLVGVRVCLWLMLPVHFLFCCNMFNNSKFTNIKFKYDGNTTHSYSYSYFI